MRYYAIAYRYFGLLCRCQSLPCFAFAIAFRDVALHCLRFARLCETLRYFAVLCLCGASHCSSLALLCLAPLSPSIANIASHAAAKPACSLSLRSTSNLYCAAATHCIPKPLPNIAIIAAAIRARHGATPPSRLMASPCAALPFRCLAGPFTAIPRVALAVKANRSPAVPLLCCADHGRSRPRHRIYSSTS